MLASETLLGLLLFGDFFLLFLLFGRLFLFLFLAHKENQLYTISDIY